jgi:hypothetical protein
MRISRVAVIVGGLGLALAGCTSTSGGSAGNSPSANAPTTATTAPATGGTAPACVVGTWKATGMNRTDNIAGTSLTSSGGGGFTVTIGADGSTTVDFTGMQPIMFSTSVAGSEIKGQYVHGGKVMGSVKATPTTDTSGTFEPVGTVDWSTLTVTVDLSSPAKIRVFDNVKITDFTGSGAAQAGNAVDTQPVLRKSTYECGGTTLKLGPPAGVTGGGTWTFQKA